METEKKRERKKERVKERLKEGKKEKGYVGVVVGGEGGRTKQPNNDTSGKLFVQASAMVPFAALRRQLVLYDSEKEINAPTTLSSSVAPLLYDVHQTHRKQAVMFREGPSPEQNISLLLSGLRITKAGSVFFFFRSLFLSFFQDMLLLSLYFFFPFSSEENVFINGAQRFLRQAHKQIRQPNII